MTYTYQLYDPQYRKNVNLKSHTKEIVKAIRSVFEQIHVEVTEDSIEIDFPEPPHHNELAAMGVALMDTALGDYTVHKEMRKTIKGYRTINRKGEPVRVYELFDYDYKKTTDLTDYLDEICACVQKASPDADVQVHSDSFFVSDLTRSECIILGRAIAKSALKKFTASVPCTRMIECVHIDKT